MSLEDLCVACTENDVGRVTQLLDDGAPIDGRPSCAPYPLYHTILSDALECTRLLLSRGARSRVNLVHLPLENTPDDNRCIETIRLLCDHGADPGFGWDKCTLLHSVLLCKRSAAVAEALIPLDMANLSRVSLRGETPAELAGRMARSGDEYSDTARAIEALYRNWITAKPVRPPTIHGGD